MKVLYCACICYLCLIMAVLFEHVFIQFNIYSICAHIVKLE